MTKKIQDHILFNNYYGEGYNFDEVKKDLEELNNCKFTDEQVWESISDMEREEWEGAMNELITLCGDHKVIAYGTCGTWQGNFESAMMFDNIEKAINACIKHCDYVEIKINAVGNIAVRATHHDGTNIFEIRVVTEKGIDYYDEYVGGDYTPMDKYQVYETIFKSWVYSTKVNLTKLF